jgi:hypothetical protein
MFPIESLVLEHRELGLVLAVAIGFGFGFVLERAGFGQSTKLAAQFYLHDMTVFKVMFGAIITAMSGLMVADGLGLTDLRLVSESAVSFTYLWPMIAGGLVLGAGFIISGYCPGTSVVGMASGNLDAGVAYLGVVIGSVIYGEFFPLVETFHFSGDKGFLFLYDVLGIPAPVLAVIVVAMALAMFLGAEKVERIFKARRGEEVVAYPKHQRALAFGAIGSLAVLGLGTLALPTEPVAAEAKRAEVIGQETLARRILDEPWTLRILDLRPEKECAERRLPGAECTPPETLDKLGLAYAAGARDLVLVDSGTAQAPAAALAYPGRVLTLDHGWKGWSWYALSRPSLPGDGATAAEREAYTFRAGLHAAMTGRKPAPPPPKAGNYVPTKKKKKGGGCS